MHFRPCCGPNSDQPDVSPPQSLAAYEALQGLLASHEQQLESEQISKGNLIRDNHQLKKRVAELEKICTMDGIEDLIATRDRQRTLIQKAHDELGDSDIKKELARELVAFMLEHGIVKEKDYSVRKL